ncbi:MAG: hypothetical protein K6F49_08325 [Saccharofermentans sp.]|nr:hypothetical protein [Saccharofermentans sp.]
MKRIKNKVFTILSRSLRMTSLLVLTGGLFIRDDRTILAAFLLLIAERLADVFV